MRKTLTLRLSSAVAVAVLLSASRSEAQEAGGFAIDRYQPTPIGDGFFAVPGGNATGRLQFRAGLVFEYAKDPLVLRQTCDPEVSSGCDPSAETDVGSVVSDQLIVHPGVSLALFDRLLLSLSLPIALVNTGDDPTTSTSTLTSPSGVSLGDLRLGGRFRVLGESRSPFQLALGAYLFVPTGDEEAFTGNGSVRGMPHISASGRLPGGSATFVYAAQVGVLARESTSLTSVRLGTELTYGVSAGVLVLDDRLQLGPELYGSTVVANDVDPFSSGTTHAELLFGAKGRIAEGFVAGAALGPGLTEGVGTPSLRALATIAYSPDSQPEGPRDRDGDGIFDKDDACPDVPGVRDPDPRKNGCPPDRDGDGIYDADDACPAVPGVRHPDPKRHGCPPDRDDDGIIDAEDACPLVPGVRDPDPKKNGCPPDRDGDGIFDAEDACPTIPGVRDPDPAKNGCPPDRDQDGIIDAEDACPDEPGVRDPDPKKNGCPRDTDGDGIHDGKDACPLEKGPADPDPAKHGCPTLVRVTKDEIKILQQPRFAFDKAEILPESAELLRQVAQAMKEHPEIKKIRIEGHTDSKGGDRHNKRLSERRAASVRKWLVDKEGIDGNRLDSEGYGEDKPIATNDTEEGRAANRRVDFRILERSADAAGGANAPSQGGAAPVAPQPAPGTPVPGAVPAPAPAGSAPVVAPKPKAEPKPKPADTRKGAPKPRR